MTLFISYCRVSTNRQGASGLGLEAQQQAVAQYVQQTGGEIVATYIEVESAASKQRPQLEKALTRCRQQKAVLLIAKLDRLARNVAFIATLMEAGVEFVAVDTPYANKLMLHVMAAFAEFEREQISARTKAALRAAKGRGVKLGRQGVALARANRQLALEHALQVAPHFAEATDRGCLTLQSVADYLNAQEIRSAGGGSWYPATVARVKARLRLQSIASLIAG